MSDAHLGAAAAVVLIIGLVYLLQRWPLDIHHTFSQHAATSKTSAVYYSVLFGVVVSLLALFFFGWFIPTLELTGLYAAVIALAIVTQQLCTFVPERKGSSVAIHRLLAGVSAVMLFASQLLLTGHTGSTAVVISVLCMTALIIAITIKGARLQYALLFQIAYYLAYSAPIIWLSVRA